MTGMHAAGDIATGRARSRGMAPAALALSAVFGLAAAGIAALWVAQGLVDGPLASPDTLAAESVRALTDADLSTAEAAIGRELAWGERRPSAWCRLAYVEFERSGAFGPKVSQALLKSYAVAPLDAETFAWRLRFVFDHWTEADPDLRRHAMAEARAFNSQWPTRPTVQALVGQVRDPAGQFALRLALRGAEPPVR